MLRSFNISLVKHFFRKMATTSSKTSATAAPTAFHEIISKEHATYKPEANRYLLYVCYSCPFASRTLMARKLKKLDDLVPAIPVHPVFNDENLWQFHPSIAEDPVLNAKLLREIYLTFHPDYNGRYVVPVLFDTKTRTIVNNESAEIIRIFNTAFNDLVEKPTIDLYPSELRDEIEHLNPWILEKINNGVYKAGLSKSQEQYETHCKAVFEALDKVDKILAKNRFLAGKQFTEADIRLFTTMVRFPTVYECHFKCNLKSLRDELDYPNIFKWMKIVYQIPGIESTVNQEHIKQNYYMSMKKLNPSRLVPLYDGPDLTEPRLPTNESDFAWFK